MQRMTWFAGLAAIILVGCEKSPEIVSATDAAATNAIPSAKGMVAVRIDGKDLYREEIVRKGKAVLLLNMNKARKTKVRKREVRALENYCKMAVSREIAKTAVERYLDDRKLAIPSNVIRRVTRDFERKYGVMSRRLRRFHKLADLKFMLGEEAFRADEMISEMAAYEVMTNDVIQSARIDVSAKEIENRIEMIRTANLRVAATNAVVFANATNVWRTIVKNEMTFEEAAKKFSQDQYISEGCEWGCFTREQLEDDPAVLAILPTLKPGDITPPIESDGGLAILRKDEDDNDKTFSFSRVFFRLPYFYDEETPAQARSTIHDDKCRLLVRETIKDYMQKLKIEYPCGTNLVWKISPDDFK